MIPTLTPAKIKRTTLTDTNQDQHKINTNAKSTQIPTMTDSDKGQDETEPNNN